MFVILLYKKYKYKEMSIFRPLRGAPTESLRQGPESPRTPHSILGRIWLMNDNKVSLTDQNTRLGARYNARRNCGTDVFSFLHNERCSIDGILSEYWNTDNILLTKY